MNMLSNLTTSADITEDKDTLGGGGGKVFESDAYRGAITLAYLQKSKGGALGLFVTLKTEAGEEIKQAIYLTSGDDKGNKNYYEKDGVKSYLPGFNLGNSLALLTVGKEISALETETKVINLYNFESKAEVPTKVEMVTDLLGQEIIMGLVKQRANKNQKNEATGKYEPTADIVESNEIDKFFCAKDDYLNLTATEIKAQRAGQTIEQPFFVAWLEKWKGQTKDRTIKGALPASAPKAGAPKPAGGAGKPANSLFG